MVHVGNFDLSARTAILALMLLLLLALAVSAFVAPRLLVPIQHFLHVHELAWFPPIPV